MSKATSAADLAIGLFFPCPLVLARVGAPAAGGGAQREGDESGYAGRAHLHPGSRLRLVQNV